ncbi:MAG: RagB/SusD family nutrient uptake outer membrane protein [Candidatus Cyclobacteriaceae bacterium M3_2C_046]
MKNFNKYIYILIGFLLLSACEVEENVYDFLTPSNFYKNKEDAESALYAAYDILQNQDYYPSGVYTLGEAPSFGATIEGTDSEEVADYDWDEIMPTINSVWETLYEGINRANAVIDRVPGISNMTQEDKDLIVAEARFLRALHYFNLVRLWGQVPFTDHEITAVEGNDHHNNNTAPQVWNLIISDLEFAEDILPETRPTKSPGRVTRYAAKALLADVYLQRSGLSDNAPDPSHWSLSGVDEWAKAEEKTWEVIQSDNYVLLQDFNDAFVVENNKERVFEVQFLPNITGEGNYRPMFTNPSGALSSARTFGLLRGTPEFYLMWDTTDLRFETTWLTDYISSETGEREWWTPEDEGSLGAPFTEKFRVSDGIERDNGLNLGIYRYAEILLMHAEAALESGNGDPYYGLNLVRQRAGLEPLSGLSEPELREAIRNERIMELAFEGKAYFDYQRWGIVEEMGTAKGFQVDDRHYLYPIPGDERIKNPQLNQVIDKY